MTATARKVYGNGVEGAPAEIGDMVCAEHPDSLNQIVGVLTAVNAETTGTTYSLRLDGGSELTIWEPAHPNLFKWRIKKIHDDEAWHPRHSAAIELRERLFGISTEILTIGQHLRLPIAMGGYTDPSDWEQLARSTAEQIAGIEDIYAELPEGWRERYMEQVRAGWE
ncbi:hypothetical protein ACFVAJ_17520 [Agromyces sp. NPDC057679]|uniref:hypothetical protein n=1 Tax=Agromyces sp. NPDC057679 TaxID=3346207 RepID=UPI00366E7970